MTLVTLYDFSCSAITLNTSLTEIFQEHRISSTESWHQMSDQTDILVYLFFGQIVPDSNQYFDI